MAFNAALSSGAQVGLKIVLGGTPSGNLSCAAGIGLRSGSSRSVCPKPVTKFDHDAT